MDRRRAKERFGILFIGLFCLRAHPTIREGTFFY